MFLPDNPYCHQLELGVINVYIGVYFSWVYENVVYFDLYAGAGFS